MSNQNGKIRVCSLFSGIGGFELGIVGAIGEKADFVAYSEIDKYAIQIYEKHFKHKNYGDITKINVSELPDFDLLCGGFPCQSFSIAGKRGGFEDTRGTLFFEIARIARAKRPHYLFLENVKGLLSHDEGNTFATIIRTLEELGYDCEWQVLNSKNFGVPQNRERVFIIGYLRGQGRRQVFPIGESNKETHLKRGEITNASEREFGWQTRSPALAARDYKEPKIVKMSNMNMQGRRIKNSNEESFALGSGSGCENGVMLCDGVYRDKSGKIWQKEGGYGEADYWKHRDKCLIRRLTPTECERLQGFPEIKKCAIIKVCLDHQKNYVDVENKNPKLLKIVGSVEKKDLNGNVLFAVKNLNLKNLPIKKLVQSDVLINCVENGVEIHSQGKLLLNAKYAEKKNWCHQHIKIDDFVQMLVGINTITEKITSNGKGELHQNEQCLTHQKSGKMLVNSFGKEIMLSADDVKNDSIILNELLKSTTLDHLDIGNLEQKLTTLSLFVIRAISGYIPKKILNQNTFTIKIETKVGYTYGISDSQRYKCLGNAVSCPVIEAIAKKLLF